MSTFRVTKTSTLAAGSVKSKPGNKKPMHILFDRHDLDMKAQRDAVHYELALKKHAALTKDFESTCASQAAHLHFLLMLVEEAERYHAGGADKLNPRFTYTLKRRLVREMSYNRQDCYPAMVNFIASQHLFEAEEPNVRVAH